jgi:flagellar basal body-associated protein FliL
MAILVIILLVIVILVFGASSTAQSYATAQQAQAMQEVAKVAQVNAWGNLVTLLTVAFVVILVIAVVAAIAWLWLKRAALQSQMVVQQQGSGSRQPSNGGQPQIDVNALLGLVLMQMLEKHDERQQVPPQLSAPQDQLPDPKEIWWLR